MSTGEGKLTLAGGIATSLLVAAAGWLGATFMQVYGASAAGKEIKAMRDSQVVDMQNRIGSLESAIRNCKH